MITTKFIQYYGKDYSVVVNGDGTWYIEGDLTSDNPYYQKDPTDKNIKSAIKYMKTGNAIITANAPKCKGCKKSPLEISEYNHRMNPIKWVEENERFVSYNQFYCTTCYILAGQPRF